MQKLKNLKNNIYIKSSFLLVIYQYIFFGINFCGQLVLLRLIAPEYFGTIGIVLAVVNISNMALSLTVTFPYIQKKHTPTLFNSAMFLSVINWLVIFIISMCLYYPLSLNYGAEIAGLVVLITGFKLFDFIRNVITADMEKNLNFKTGAIVIGTSSSLSLLVAIITAYNGFEITSLIIREVLVSLLSFLMITYISKNKVMLNTYDLTEVKDMIKYGGKTIFARLLESLFFRLPIIICDQYFTRSTTGYLTQVFYLAQLINSALSPITQKVAFVFYSKNNNRLIPFIINVLIIILITPMAIIIFFYPREILFFVWGERWVGAALVLKYSVLFIIFLPVFHNLKSLYFGIQKQHVLAFSLLLGMVVMLIINSIERSEYFLAISISFSILFVCGYLSLIYPLLKKNDKNQ